MFETLNPGRFAYIDTSFVAIISTPRSHVDGDSNVLVLG
jgi:hypothetical protein